MLELLESPVLPVDPIGRRNPSLRRAARVLHLPKRDTALAERQPHVGGVLAAVCSAQAERQGDRMAQRYTVCPRKAWLVIAVMALVPGTAQAQSPISPTAPPFPSNTLWRFLGIPQAFGRMRDATANRRGNNPNAERTPPLLRLADPANLKSDVPAIKAAAEVKAQEDLAPQKIKALKYLAMVGCGCYGGVAEALAAALEDCTEEVRYEAARAVQSAIMTNPCACNAGGAGCQSSCCSKELAVKMYERAYGRDDKGCPIEPSERVRGVLENALSMCPPDQADMEMGPKDTPIIPVDPGVPQPVIPVDPGPGIRPLQPPPAPALNRATFDLNYRFGTLAVNHESQAFGGSPAPTQTGLLNHVAPAVFANPAAAQPVQMVTQNVCGEVVQGKSNRGYVRVAFAEGIKPPVGTVLQVYHDYVLRTENTGTLTIVDYEGHHAIAGPRAWENTKVALGDYVECSIRVPATVAPATSAAAPASQQPAAAGPKADVAHAFALGENTPPPATGKKAVHKAPAASSERALPPIVTPSMLPPAPQKSANKPTAGKPAADQEAVSRPAANQSPANQPAATAPSTPAVAVKPPPVYIAPGVVAPTAPSDSPAGASKSLPASKPAPASAPTAAQKPALPSWTPPANRDAAVKPATAERPAPATTRLPGINNGDDSVSPAAHLWPDPTAGIRVR